MNEDKYFVFDNDTTVIKYYLKRIKYSIQSAIYKFQLNSFHPKSIEQKKYYVSICAIFKNESQYLHEWIEFHRIIGIEHFYLYNNFSNDNYLEVLDKYIKEGLVTLVEWPIMQGQMKAYSDCVEKFSSETNWISFIDLDEFIVPNSVNNIRDALKPFERNRPSVIAYWKLFGTSGLIDRNRSGLVTEDFYLCWRKYSDVGKFFFNTAYSFDSDNEKNKHMHDHWSKYHDRLLPSVNFYDKVVLNGVNVANNNFPAVQINHYFTKSYKEYLEKSSRGDAYYEMNPRDMEYFLWHEQRCQEADFHIKKYTIQLKNKMGNSI